jgi:hypothetical protein
MMHGSDPFWEYLADPLVPASGTAWTPVSTGKALDSGAVIGRLEFLMAQERRPCWPFYPTSLACKPLDQYKAENPSTSTSSLYFASLPQMTPFQFYGPDNSFADANNRNQYR